MSRSTPARPRDRTALSSPLTSPLSGRGGEAGESSAARWTWVSVPFGPGVDPLDAKGSGPCRTGWVRGGRSNRVITWRRADTRADEL